MVRGGEGCGYRGGWSFGWDGWWEKDEPLQGFVGEPMDVSCMYVPSIVLMEHQGEASSVSWLNDESEIQNLKGGRELLQSVT